MHAVLQRITLLITSLFVVAAASLAVTLSVPAYANANAAQQAACQAIGNTWTPSDPADPAAGGTCGDGETQINNTVENLINLFSIIVGIIAVVMIIIGGFLYVTSGGDSNKLTTAKNTIIYAVVGLIIVALAQIIVRFVLDQAT